ncbi:MAG: glycoside hydrolase family 3 N-terminal domain-containing protein [Salinibacter sp.]
MNRQVELLDVATDPEAYTVLNSEAFARRMRAGGAPDWPAAVADRVDSLLARMTLEEKVGQMTQLEIGMVTSGDYPETIDPAKLKNAVQKHHVGSILNVGAGAYSLDHWHEIVRAIQDAAAETRLQIPVLYGIDAVHGANYTRESVLFPQQLGMAATWNPALMRKSAAITARDVRASGISWNFSPVLDVGRDVRWPRLYETFGEDPYLASVMGLAAVRGYQGTDPGAPRNVAATAKHYIGYSGPNEGLDRTPAHIPEFELRERYLQPFREAVNAGVLSVMVNSAEVNGTPAHASHALLTGLLRKELGFQGLVVSDWRDIKKLVDVHHVAATEREATKKAVLAGVDMSMVPSDYSFYTHLLDLVRDGEVPKSRINEAVRRILSVKFAVGLFEDPTAGIEQADEVGSPSDHETALRAARESIVLLRNSDDLLPLSGEEQVLVTGPTAQSMQSLNNGWTYTWQGRGLAQEMFAGDRPTIYEAIRARIGDEQVRYVPGTTLDSVRNVDAAVAAARQSDVAVVALGEGAYAETPGNVRDLELPEAQQRLLRRVAATNTPVVLVLVEGRPRLPGEGLEATDAVLAALNPGTEGGQAVMEVLYGDVNPSGHLPITYPSAGVGLASYDHKNAVSQNGFDPLFSFGSGLSYTTFAYRNLTVSDTPVQTDALAAGDSVTVSVTVANTGDRAGKDVVQLYLRDHVATVTPAVRELRRFAKVALDPGERRRLTFHLKREDLAYVDQEGRSVVEPGAFSVMVDTLKQPFEVTGEPLRSEEPAGLHSGASASRR